MFRRSAARAGDLQPIGVTRHLTVVRRDEELSPWAKISIFSLSTLAMFAAGAAWLDHHGTRLQTSSTHPAAQAASTEAAPSASFPSWVEVPYLTGPLSLPDGPDVLSPADGPRTFLLPGPEDRAGQPILLPPRANPRLPLLGRAPLDVARLTHEQQPTWNESVERQESATSVPQSAATTLGPDASQSSLDQAGSSATLTLPADPAPAPILSPKPAQMLPPTEVAVQPAQPVAASPPPAHTATLSPAPAQQLVDRTTVITPPADAGASVAPILNPGPASHARSLRRRATTTASQAKVPDRDAEQTASIISPPKPARTRVDAGAVAHASLHRARAVRPAATSSAPAPPSPWALPSALAPTD